MMKGLFCLSYRALKVPMGDNVCAQVGDTAKFGRARPYILDRAYLTPHKTCRPHMDYHSEFDRCRSNGKSVPMDID